MADSLTAEAGKREKLFFLFLVAFDMRDATFDIFCCYKYIKSLLGRRVWFCTLMWTSDIQWRYNRFLCTQKAEFRKNAPGSALGVNQIFVSKCSIDSTCGPGMEFIALAPSQQPSLAVFPEGRQSRCPSLFSIVSSIKFYCAWNALLLSLQKAPDYFYYGRQMQKK